jgi:predicted PurR-regulated permease PerM
VTAPTANQLRKEASGAAGAEREGLIVAPLDEAPVEAPAEEPPFSLTQADVTLILIGGLFLLASLAALAIAKSIVMPVLFAFMLRLLLNPALRFLEGMRVPRVIGSLLLLLTVAAVLAGLLMLLGGPAVAWISKVPEDLPRLQERLAFLREPMEAMTRFLHTAQGLAKLDSSVIAIPSQEGTLPEQLFHLTWSLLAGIFTTGLLLFFLLVAGDTFLRRLVEVLPSFKEKRQVVEISQQVEADISTYLFTITIMNGLVGLATALVMWACGVGDPVLWGAVAFVLNYVPILGPLLGVGLFTLVGLLTIESSWWAFLPAALYLLIHMLEGEGITPMLLARRFTLNPVLVIVALIFWYWIWGVLGAVLAVPLLAIAKIICDRVRPLNALGHFLAG